MGGGTKTASNAPSAGEMPRTHSVLDVRNFKSFQYSCQDLKDIEKRPFMRGGKCFLGDGKMELKQLAVSRE